MLQVKVDNRPQENEEMNIFDLPSIVINDQPQGKIDELVAALSPHISWGERQVAAQKLGYLASPHALPGLLHALPSDPFWMVRCAIIQALERIGDSSAVSILREVASNDSFQVVRSYAAKAIVRLS